MSSQTFNTKVRAILNKAAKDAAKTASKRMYGIARRTIGSAEDESFNVRTKSGYEGSSVSTSFYGDYTPKRYQRIGNLEQSFKDFVEETTNGYGAKLEFDTRFMPYDNHTHMSGGTRYDKEAVLRFDYEQGWHGSPVAFGQKMKQTKPAPAEQIRAQIDRLTINDFITGDVEEEIMDDIFDLFDDEINRKMYDG